MYKRIVSILLCVLMIAGCTLCLCSCSKEESIEYPVTVAGTVIESEPENIVVLSDCLADIISYMGYDLKMVGRSVETTQEFLSVVPTVGNSANPDVEAIVSYETNLVIADSTLSDNAKAALNDAKIPVLTLEKANSFVELKALYENLGTALGGGTTGKAQGTDSYAALEKTLGDFKDAVPNDIVKTACYLYLDENNELCTLTKDTIEFELFSYNGAINIFSTQEAPLVDHELLKIGTPTYIFYDNEAVLDYLRNNAELSTMGALNNGNTYQIEFAQFNRQGTTFEELAYRMLEFMFITSEETPDEATPEEATIADTDDTAPTTQEGETVVGFISEIEE